MRYEVINPSEARLETLKIIEQSDTDFRCDKTQINAADCDIYLRGETWIIEYEGVIIYEEYRSERYPFFEQAIHYMNPSIKADWKTVSELTTFRNAIRETTVATMFGGDLLEELYENITKEDYDQFMIGARDLDKMHHGVNTF